VSPATKAYSPGDEPDTPQDPAVLEEELEALHTDITYAQSEKQRAEEEFDEVNDQLEVLRQRLASESARHRRRVRIVMLGVALIVVGVVGGLLSPIDSSGVLKSGVAALLLGLSLGVGVALINSARRDEPRPAS
jgi:Flp pilus assembly protein TadB